MAKAQGVSKDTVCRIWQAHGTQTASAEDIQALQGQAVCGKTHRCGRRLFPHPPDKAVVLCVDEKKARAILAEPSNI